MLLSLLAGLFRPAAIVAGLLAGIVARADELDADVVRFRQVNDAWQWILNNDVCGTSDAGARELLKRLKDSKRRFCVVMSSKEDWSELASAPRTKEISDHLKMVNSLTVSGPPQATANVMVLVHCDDEPPKFWLDGRSVDIAGLKPAVAKSTDTCVVWINLIPTNGDLADIFDFAKVRRIEKQHVAVRQILETAEWYTAGTATDRTK